MLLPVYDAAPAFNLLCADDGAGGNRSSSETSSPLGLQAPRHGRLVQGERFATEVIPWSTISPHWWQHDSDFLIGTHKMSDALDHSTSTTTWVSHCATRLPSIPHILSEGDLMTLYKNKTTLPPTTLPHMATLLSCVRVVPGSDSNVTTRQNLSLEHRRFLPRPIQSVSDRPPQRCHTITQHIMTETPRIYNRNFAQTQKNFE